MAAERLRAHAGSAAAARDAARVGIPVVVLVDVVVAKGGEQVLVVEATGTVQAERVITLQPEISGIIRKEAAGFEVGGRFTKGQELLRIDARDAQIALRQRKAAAQAARLELSLERGRAHVANREWKLLEGKVNTTAEGKALALRKPQQRAAQARIAQADAAVDQAKLNLKRTSVTAPFDCVVQSKRAAEGQLVSPASPMATLVATDRFFVIVSVPVAKLSALQIPGYNGQVGSKATITQRTGAGPGSQRQGRVLRLLSDLDPNGRMARVVVAIDRPLDAPEGAKQWTPMLLGAYVRVELIGRTLSGVVRVPRLALQEGGRVFIADGGKLAIRDVDVVWSRREEVLVRDGVTAGERLITSRIPVPTPGMSLTVRKGSEVTAKAADGEGSEGAEEARP